MLFTPHSSEENGLAYSQYLAKESATPAANSLAGAPANTVVSASTKSTSRGKKSIRICLPASEYITLKAVSAAQVAALVGTQTQCTLSTFATAFAVSSALPPPTPITQSQLLARAA